MAGFVLRVENWGLQVYWVLVKGFNLKVTTIGIYSA